MTVTYPFCLIVTVTPKSGLLPRGSFSFSILARLLSYGLAFFYIGFPLLMRAPAFLCVQAGGLLYNYDDSAEVVLVFK